ncbi:MAG TPA: succinylglutamate desuccinylase/aspartoacylase family protein [Acetobacteraceae bacterium]|nr:succinylglutamate desuccinylase/aspartoacylase family protein [Acetobacteraceae bacterium]
MGDSAHPLPGPLPQFAVRVECPDIAPWLDGNTGVRGFICRDSGKAGPHVGLIALTHGNEIGGAIALVRLLDTDLRPQRGRITFGFLNLAAFARFDPRQPTASRFVDEDMNRLWDPSVLDGPRRSSELARAREVRPLLDEIDILLDLHSMLWPSDPLILCGASDKGRRLALGIGAPPLIIADHGHASGRRIIDYPPFVNACDPRAANLVEAGQHWEFGTVDTMLAAIAGVLRHAGLIDEHPALPPPASSPPEPRFAEVIRTITASSGNFTFVQPFRGGEIVPKPNTLIALDGEEEIRTPCADCLLVMPSLRPSRGHTAVRLARLE